MKNTIIVLISICAIMLALKFKNKREIIFTNLAPKPIGSYSQAIKIGGTLYVSGQIGLKTDGALDSVSIESESKQVLENIKTIVEAADMKMSDVSKATIYTTNLNYFSKINDVYKNYFVTNYPARETIEVNALPKNAHIEISVIANN
jgi:2-iminobutanoate/2-iminopropanoate deaminase